MRFGDRQLVEEHLGPLVRMRGLDAADEPDGLTVVVDGVQQMVSFVREEPLGHELRRWSVEQRRSGEQKA
jgi:hypothetical protein